MIHFSYSKGNSVNYDVCQTEKQYFRRREKLVKAGYTVEICEPRNIKDRFAIQGPNK